MRENFIGKQEPEYSVCYYKNKMTILRQTQHCRCDNLTRSTKRQNTQITQNNTTQKVALVNSTVDTLKKKQNRQKLVLVAFYDIQPGNGAGPFL